MPKTDAGEGEQTTQTAERSLREADSSTIQHLLVLHTPDDGCPQRVTLGPYDLEVGRVQGPGRLCIHDQRLSRVHARIAWSEATRLHGIEDLRSRNGVYLNGVTSSRSNLAPGDVVRLGDTVFQYQTGNTYDPVRKHIARYAATRMTVLIAGETGVGKEVMAREIHAKSGLSGAFVPVNCATLSRDLVSSELFGHVRGAYSGADRTRPGLFREADGGTLFLDEVGDLPLDTQGCLLRALQEGVVRPVGADREVPVQVRVVSATNVPLEQALESGRFRPDLFARLAETRCTIPPLRERRWEVIPLLKTLVARHGGEVRLDGDAAEALVLWEWPFNVRELEALAKAFAVTPAAGTLDWTFLEENKPEVLTRETPKTSPSPPDPRGSGVYDLELSGPEREFRAQLESELRRWEGNVAQVARAMGKPRSQVYRWLRRYSIDADAFRRDQSA